MMRQTSFADLEYANKNRLTWREVFLNEMEVVVPWSALLARLEPHYPKSGRRGRQPMALSSMLRICCAQNWFNLSGRQMEDALYEIESRRHFLEKHDLTTAMLEEINSHLKAQGLLVSKGSMVDATIIHAPSLTKNQDNSRAPEMHQTKKGNQWYFRMKIHVGADVDSGAVHSVEVTAANEADITLLPKLLRTEDEAIFADAGYTSDEYKRGSRKLGLHWCVQDKRKQGQKLSSSQRKRNRKQSSIRARAEHVFRVISLEKSVAELICSGN